MLYKLAKVRNIIALARNLVPWAGIVISFNMATIAGIEDFCTQFKMFAVYSLLLVVCSNKSIRNQWIDTDLRVYSTWLSSKSDRGEILGIKLTRQLKWNVRFRYVFQLFPPGRLDLPLNQSPTAILCFRRRFWFFKIMLSLSKNILFQLVAHIRI